MASREFREPYQRWSMDAILTLIGPSRAPNQCFEGRSTDVDPFKQGAGLVDAGIVFVSGSSRLSAEEVDPFLVHDWSKAREKP
ncbi:MAG TPA: hypothetical protein VKU87_08160, partial [Thermomicrobiaceae bacterium]|nr:hypothetical protein [Thermomicrobiaceae bacterium]